MRERKRKKSSRVDKVYYSPDMNKKFKTFNLAYEYATGTKLIKKRRIDK